MREENLLLAVRRFCRSTTDSQHPYGRYPNLVQGLAIERLDQLWCADSPAAFGAGNWAGA